MGYLRILAVWPLLACCNPFSDGEGDSAILGGTEDTADVFTGVVSVNGNCTGTFIDKTHVLTAAHCFCACQSASRNACDCDHTASVTVITTQGTRTVEGVVNINPDFFISFKEETCGTVIEATSDLAVITVTKKPDIFYQDIPLATSSSMHDHKVYLSGFGRTTCTDVNNKARYFAENRIAEIYPESGRIHITKDKGGLMYLGDSGGPLIDLAVGYEVAGVASVASCQEWSDYESTYSHLSWLEEAKTSCSGKTYCCGEDQCVDLKTDVANCGTCGAACSTGQACIDGTCRTPPCTPNWSCTPYSACSNATKTRTCTDSNHCGTTTGKPPESASCPMRVEIRRLYGSNGQGCSNPTADWDHCHTVGTSLTCLVGQSASLAYQQESPPTHDRFWVVPASAVPGFPDTAMIDGVSMSRLDACYHAGSTQHVLEPQDQLKIESIENASSQGINGWTCVRVGYVKTGSPVAGDPYMIPTYRIKIPNQSSRFVSTFNSPSDPACNIQNTGIAWWGWNTQ